jgi:hypothetical protein
MIKLTVKEYATNNQLSTQRVYKLIELGKIEVFEQNGTKYILLDDNAQYKELATNLQQENNSLKREIELQNELIKSLQFNANLFSRLLPNTDNADIISIENKLQKKKKKKKKKSKKELKKWKQ